MAERTILVCDECGKPAAETVTIKVSKGNFVKDLCSTHVDALVAGARKPRPGRRKGVVATGSTRGSAKKTSSTRAKGSAKRPGRPRARRGRPPKAS